MQDEINVESIHGSDHGLPFLHPKLEKYMELKEMEELFKAGVNRAAIQAYLRNAAILRDPGATPEMKELAAANVKAISNNQPIPKQKAPKQPKQKAAAAEQAMQLAQAPQAQKPAAAVSSSEAPPMEFHEVFARHHGIDPAKFKETWHAMSPEQQKITKDWHAEQVAKPAPAPVKVSNSPVTPVASQPLKIQKSVDALYDLFAQLRKHI